VSELYRPRVQVHGYCAAGTELEEDLHFAYP
jgi:hypothetical protein